MVHEHFQELLGESKSRPCSLNWEANGLPTLDGRGLDNPFCEVEVWAAVCASPAQKAPGPDGFSGTFFRTCWQIIKNDVMAVFHMFYSLSCGGFCDTQQCPDCVVAKEKRSTASW